MLTDRKINDFTFLSIEDSVNNSEIRLQLSDNNAERLCNRLKDDLLHDIELLKRNIDKIKPDNIISVGSNISINIENIISNYNFFIDNWNNTAGLTDEEINKQRKKCIEMINKNDIRRKNGVIYFTESGTEEKL